MSHGNICGHNYLHDVVVLVRQDSFIPTMDLQGVRRLAVKRDGCWQLAGPGLPHPSYPTFKHRNHPDVISCNW